MDSRGLDAQPLIDAVFDNAWDVATKALGDLRAASDDAPPWLHAELALVEALIDLKQGRVGEAQVGRSRAARDLEWREIDSPPDFVRVIDQAAIVAFCAGDRALGKELLAMSGEEMDRVFRRAPIGALITNAYHRGLAYRIDGQHEEAKPHVELALSLAERVFARYHQHPELIALRALRDASDARTCQSLPFRFWLFGVPCPLTIVT